MMRAEMGMRLDEIRYYIRRTEQIRHLSAPKIRKNEGATAYYQRLLSNFSRIRELTEDNHIFLQNHLYPLLKHTEIPLEQDDIIFLRNCVDRMLDAQTMQNLDAALAARIADRLMIDAEQKGDLSYIIEQKDYQVLVYYILKTISDRMDGYTELSEYSRQKCREAAEYLYSYLDKEQYKQLPDVISRERVLTNARYILCLYDDKMPSRRKSPVGEAVLQIAERALALAEDDFYRRSVPKYDWNNHIVRTLQYVGSIQAMGGRARYSEEECQVVARYMTKLRTMMEEADPKKRTIGIVEARVMEVRSHYFAGLISQQDYVTELQRLFDEGKDDKEFNQSFCGGVEICIEYMLALDDEELSPDEKECLWDMYQAVLSYAARMSNNKSFIYLLECLAYMLDSYRQEAVGYDFESLCLNCMATLRPLTYVHMMMVGEISACLAKYLIDKHPVLFIGVEGCNTTDEVRSRKKEVLEFVRHSGKCHDVGKLLFLDTRYVYERNLLDEEFKLIQNHSRAGGYILERHESTKEYALVAYGHHKWYDDSAGYPLEWTNAGRPRRVVIDLVCCADCMDAATDRVGRSYSHGISLDHFIQELREQRGTRYAPYVVDLFEDEAVVAEIRMLLERDRTQMYYQAFQELQSRAEGETEK